jgi:hypothetical protein
MRGCNRHAYSINNKKRFISDKAKKTDEFINMGDVLSAFNMSVVPQQSAPASANSWMILPLQMTSIKRLFDCHQHSYNTKSQSL